MVCARASKVVLSLRRLMAKGAGRWPHVNFMSTVNSILLYGAKEWLGIMRTKVYSKRVLALYIRSTLRVTCVYLTVSISAVFFVASIIPIDLLAIES